VIDHNAEIRWFSPALNDLVTEIDGAVRVSFWLARVHPDLILLDMMMSESNALEW
jgi:CheY-like chemotaxis protein